MIRKSRHIVALATAAWVVSNSVVLAQAPTYAQLQAEVQQLEQRLKALEDKSTISPADIDRTVRSVLEDADRRSKVFADSGGLTAGYDKGFFIRSQDGNYLLRPGLLFQFRGVTTSRSGGNDDTQSGFEIRRLRPRIDGNLITPDLTYSIVLDANRSGGGVSLLDAWAQYRFAPQWAVKAGQFRESWYHEGDVPDSNQLTVERSLIDSILAGSQVDRVQGVSLIYGGTKENAIRTEVTYHDGANSKNTDFRDAQPGATPTDPPIYIANFGFGGRLEYKAFGDWANYRDFTAKGNKENLLVFGAGIDWTQNGDTNTYRYTADAQWENTTGWNAYAALNGVTTDVSGANTNRFDWGALIQGGYQFRPAWEVFGRYDVVDLDNDFVAGTHLFNEFTAGVNYFLGKDGSALHRAKITFDLIYLPDGAPSNQTGVGVLANPNGDDEWVLRGQLQLLL